MKESKLAHAAIAATAVIAFAPATRAATVTWNNAVQDTSVSFFDASNWTAAPAGDGTDVWKQESALKFEVTLTGDAAFSSISKPNNKTGGAIALNLAGNTLASAQNFVWQLGAFSASNGTFSVGGYMTCGNVTGGYPAQMTFTGPLEMSVSGKTSNFSLHATSNVTFRAGANVRLSDGARLWHDGVLALEDRSRLVSGFHISPYGTNSCLRVSGGSELITSTQIPHGGKNACTVVDASSVVVSNRMTFAGDNSSLTLDHGATLRCLANGSASLNRDIITLLGSDNAQGTGSSIRVAGGSAAYLAGLFVGYKAANCALEIDSGSVTSMVMCVASSDMSANNVNQKNATVSLSGETAFLNVTTSGIYLGTNSSSSIRFDIPANGFKDESGTARAPISTVRFVGRSITASGYEPGDTKLVLRAKAFATAHPKETITLIDAGNGGSSSGDKTGTVAVLDWLANHVEVEDITTGDTGRVFVDGYTLRYTAPRNAATLMLIR